MQQMPPLLAWIAGRKVEENLRALAITCEGGTPPPRAGRCADIAGR
jgi:hypothetical protein